MALDSVELVRRYHDALNHYDVAFMLLMFAEPAVYQSPGVGGLLIGRAAIIEAFSTYFAEHPDQHSVDESIVVLGPNTARSEWRLQATSKSTGEPYIRRGFETVTFTDDGRIIRVEVEDR